MVPTSDPESLPRTVNTNSFPIELMNGIVCEAVTFLFSDVDHFVPGFFEELAHVSLVQFANGIRVDFQELFVAVPIRCLQPVHQRGVHLKLGMHFPVPGQRHGGLGRTGTSGALAARFTRVITL